jgi:hypothetical protein
MFARGKTEGKSKHMFIDGDTIYSYGSHFPIAIKLDNDVIIFNTAGYSSTTRHHKSLVFSALSAVYGIIIQLPDCDVQKAQMQLEMNKERIELFKKKLKNARTRHSYYESGIKNFKEQNKLIEEIIIPKLIAEKI